jgi:UDP-3-O-[3-hydroxymyristoyl] glucosamine N-acyltransferase
MRLSEMNDVVSMTIVRDGEFSSLGVLSHDADKMLVVLYDPDYLSQLIANPHISCVITSSELAAQLPQQLALGICDDPRTAFYTIHLFLAKNSFYWKDFNSEISPAACIHASAYVVPRNVRIGPGTIVEPNATIMERAIIGEGVVIRAGAVIGGDDLEAKYVNGKYVILPHAGGVLLEEGVEISNNAVIMRSIYGGFSVVGKDTKVGALAHIAHNARVGRRCFIGPCTIVCGSSTIGDDVWIGPNATISSELRVGNGAKVTLGSVVVKNIPTGGRVSGNFAIEHSRFISFIKSIR